MLKIRTKRDTLLKPLQCVTGIVERRHTLPILSNVLIEASNAGLTFLATDLEVQIRATVPVDGLGSGAATLSARKLQDILRALPEEADITLEEKETRLQLNAGKSRFNLQTLPAADFPRIAVGTEPVTSFELPQKALHKLLSRVQFAMAVQDIRYYLNGMLLSVDGTTLRAVATDGHRLSYASYTIDTSFPKLEVILPRKTVSELSRLLTDSDAMVRIEAWPNQVQFAFDTIELVSKVVDGKFPDYVKVIPADHPKKVTLNRVLLLQALQRAAILSNEKIRGVRLVLTADALSILCSNNEQEEAEEELAIDYRGEALDIGFNISYLLDVFNFLSNESVQIEFGDANSSALVSLPGDDSFKYVVMPMRI